MKGPIRDVHLGRRKAMPAAETQEAPLELAAGAVGRRWLARRSAVPVTSAWRIALPSSPRRRRRGAGRRGCERGVVTAMPSRTVVTRQERREGAMQAGCRDASVARRARDRDVRSARARCGSRRPQLRRAAVAERAPSPQREHGRHPPPLVAQAGVARRAYTPRWTRWKRPALTRCEHGLGPMPGGDELAEGHNPVLPRGDPRDRLIGQWRVSSRIRCKKRQGRGLAPYLPGAVAGADASDPAPMIRAHACAPSVSAQFSVTVRVELDARQEPLGKLTAADRRGRRRASGRRPRARRRREGKRVREFTIDARDQAHWEEILRAIGSTRGRAGARLRRPHAADASRRQDRAAQQVPAEDPRRPLDGLHARRRTRLPGDRRRPLEGVRVHDQAQHRRRRHRRQRRARPRRHRARGRDAGDGGQGDAVQGVRRRRRLSDLPRHPRPGPDREHGEADRRRPSAESTSRTSRRRAASRSRSASRRSSTSPSSTTTSTGPRWW